jgi:hypothetical protein
MKLKLKIDSNTTTEELVALTALFIGLSGSRTLTTGELGSINGAAFTAPPDPAELNEGEVVVIHPTQSPDLTGSFSNGAEAPKRRRRTKEEIAAAAAAGVAAGVAAGGATSDPDPHQTLVEDAAEKATATPEDAGNADPAPTQTANATVTETAMQEPAASAPATESPSDGKTYTHADVQKLAVDSARRFGPEKVKALIAEYPHAAKIADLTDSDLPGFVAKLNALP